VYDIEKSRKFCNFFIKAWKRPLGIRRDWWEDVLYIRVDIEEIW